MKILRGEKSLIGDRVWAADYYTCICVTNLTQIFAVFFSSILFKPEKLNLFFPLHSRWTRENREWNAWNGENMRRKSAEASALVRCKRTITAATHFFLLRLGVLRNDWRHALRASCQSNICPLRIFTSVLIDFFLFASLASRKENHILRTPATSDCAARTGRNRKRNNRVNNAIKLWKSTNLGIIVDKASVSTRSTITWPEWALAVR